MQGIRVELAFIFPNTPKSVWESFVLHGYGVLSLTLHSGRVWNQLPHVIQSLLFREFFSRLSRNADLDTSCVRLNGKYQDCCYRRG